MNERWKFIETLNQDYFMDRETLIQYYISCPEDLYRLSEKLNDYEKALNSRSCVDVNELNGLAEENKDLEEARSYYQENFLTMKTERHQLKEENEQLKKENYELHKRLGDFKPFEEYMKERTSKTSVNDIIGLVKTDETTNSVELKKELYK